MVAQNIAFGVIAAVIVVGALKVVTTKNVVHAALFLVTVLAGVGASFLLVGAEFVGVTQVLVYIGAIVVLFLFGIMLTRAPIGGEAEVDNPNRWGALLVAVALAGILAFTLGDHYGDDKLPDDTRIAQVVPKPGVELADNGDVHSLDPADVEVSNTRAVSDSIFGDYLVAFEVVSVLLLAALIGAIVLARRD